MQQLIEVNPKGYGHSVTDRIARERGIVAEGENLDDALTRVSKAVLEMDALLEGRFDGDFAKQLTKMFARRIAIPGTPILAKGGRATDVSLGACTVLPLEVGSGQLNYKVFEAATAKSLDDGMGTGYDLTSLKNPVCDLLRMNDFLLQNDGVLCTGGRRPPSSMASLDAQHPEILQFIQAKRQADFGRWRFNLSVKFQGSRSKVDSEFKALVGEIATAAHYCGEPGVLFFDRFEDDNPMPQIPYLSTAPCAEVGLAAEEECHFWYLNLAEFARRDAFDWDGLVNATQLSIRALDAIVELSIRAGSPAIVALKRRVGLGVMGFHSLLIRLGISYASENAEALARQISEVLTFNAYSASAKLAARRGPFPGWEVSRWIDQDWIARKVSRTTGVLPVTAWPTLIKQIATKGIRHASLVAYPPTGTSSELLGVSKSYEPLFSLTGHSQPELDDQDELIPEVQEFLARDRGQHTEGSVLATARDISPLWHLRLHSAFQSFADESGSKTVNVENGASVDQVRGMFEEARSLGLKGLSIFRDNCLEERANGGQL